jgi:hypothetical protein
VREQCSMKLHAMQVYKALQGPCKALKIAGSLHVP